MSLFRKKPVVIEALQWEGATESGEAIRAAFGENIAIGEYETMPPQPFLEIRTLEGTMRAAPKDYIIKGVKGELYPCKSDIFEATYESVLNQHDAHSGCDFIPRVEEFLGMEGCADDLLLQIDLLKRQAEVFQQIAALFQVDLENQDPLLVANYVQEAKQSFDRLSSTAALSFGEALIWLKRGHKVCSAGWNGKGMFLSLTPGQTIPAEKFWSPHNKAHAEAQGGQAEVLGSISLKMADGKIMMGWTPNTADMLADDWMVLV